MTGYKMRLRSGKVVNLNKDSPEDKEDDDDDSFVEFYCHHCGCNPKEEQEADQHYVKKLKIARKESKKRRQDAEFENRYEEWWKKYSKDGHGSLLLKEQMRGMVHFRPLNRSKV